MPLWDDKIHKFSGKGEVPQPPPQIPLQWRGDTPFPNPNPNTNPNSTLTLTQTVTLTLSLTLTLAQNNSLTTAPLKMNTGNIVLKHDK